MSNSPTEKKAPNTPRSTAKAAMGFYTKEADSSQSIPSREQIDQARAARIVDEVFNDETLEEGYKRKLEHAFDNPPDLSRVAEKELLQKREGLQDLGKMEAAVSMANKGKEMSRMSPDQIEIEVAHELLDLKKAIPALEQDIGDRSTPIPEIDRDMFLSSAENSPVRETRSRRKKGGRGGTLGKLSQKAMLRQQEIKFIDLLQENADDFEAAVVEFKDYLKKVNQREMLGPRMRERIYVNIEKGKADDFELDTHEVRYPKGGKSLRRKKQTKRKRNLKKGTRKRSKRRTRKYNSKPRK